MAKILVITDDPNATTGNGKVCKNLLKEFEKLGHTITSIIAWNCLGGNNKFHYKLWPIDPSKQIDHDTGLKVQYALKLEDPDIIFCHGDIWNFQYMPHMKTRAKKIGYLTVDFEPLSTKYKDAWESFDALITPSVFGQKTISKYIGLASAYIPEGIDPEIFKPQAKEVKEVIIKNLKNNAMKNNLNMPSFFITMLARPIQRKNLPAGIRAIGKLAYEHSDIAHICLYDLMKSGVNAYEHDMTACHNRYLPPKMAKFAVSDVGPISQNCTDEIIASYLSVSNILVMPTMGEGFGLPVLEAMACGCVPVVTNCTSMPDLVQPDRGYLVDVGAIITDVASDTKNMEQSLISDVALYEAIKHAYNHPEKLAKMSSNGIAYSHKFTWERCAKSIDKIMLDALSGTKNMIVMEKV